MALYTKVRPTTWDDVIGNEDAVAVLRKTFSKKDHAHVFLFYGDAGCGKTTLARLAAREVGADETAIIEINSANNRGIDTARQVIDQMRYAPTEGSATVFIIDEVHKTTSDWQNAMLKPLEDTPGHVYFFLATTDPAKLGKAFRTRCTEIKLAALSVEDLTILLRKTNRAEGLGVEKELLAGIAEAAGGSPRRALVALEKVASVEDPDARARLVKAGVPDEEDAETIELCRALLSGTWPTVAAILKALPLDDPEKVRYAVLGYMNAVLLSGRKNDRAALALESFSEPTYNTGKFGITLAAYQTTFAG